MKPFTLKMISINTALSVSIDFWNRERGDYSAAILTLDTGSSITILSEDIFERLGYDVDGANVRTITTASRTEYVREVCIEKVRFGDTVLEDITVYAYDFPEESLSAGVIGMDILSRFDIHLLFSKGLIELYPIRGFLDEGAGHR